MKVIQNKWADRIIARGFAAVTVWPFVFVRTDTTVTRQLLTHEQIHARQQLELLWVLFFVWYGLEWLVRYCIDRRSAYRSVSFEQEAYRNDWNSDYPAERPLFAWWKFCRMGNVKY